MAKEKETRKPAADARKTEAKKSAGAKPAAAKAASEEAGENEGGLPNPDGLDVSQFLPNITPSTDIEKKIIEAIEKNLKDLPKLLERDLARRPTPNPPVENSVLNYMMQEFGIIKLLLENHAGNIRELDRKRLNSVGIRKQGFIDRAYAHAEDNDLFMPKYLTIEKFSDDFEYFNRLRRALELLMQVREFLLNLINLASDVTYTDALEFYASVREAAGRRIDGAESVHKDLEPFFAKSRSEEAEETKKESKTNAIALIDSKREGRMVIENINPKVIKGSHKIIEEKFTDSAQFKESSEGEIKE
jgi:hypothetical protein